MEHFIELLKEEEVYDDVIMLSYPKLNSLIINKRVDLEIIEQVRTETSHRITLSKKRNMGEE